MITRWRQEAKLIGWWGSTEGEDGCKMGVFSLTKLTTGNPTGWSPACWCWWATIKKCLFFTKRMTSGSAWPLTSRHLWSGLRVKRWCTRRLNCSAMAQSVTSLWSLTTSLVHPSGFLQQSRRFFLDLILSVKVGWETTRPAITAGDLKETNGRVVIGAGRDPCGENEPPRSNTARTVFSEISSSPQTIMAHKMWRNNIVFWCGVDVCVEGKGVYGFCQRFRSCL